jgi:hypothetical protein
MVVRQEDDIIDKLSYPQLLLPMVLHATKDQLNYMLSYDLVSLIKSFLKVDISPTSTQLYVHFVDQWNLIGVSMITGISKLNFDCIIETQLLCTLLSSLEKIYILRKSLTVGEQFSEAIRKIPQIIKNTTFAEKKKLIKQGIIDQLMKLLTAQDPKAVLSVISSLMQFFSEEGDVHELSVSIAQNLQIKEVLTMILEENKSNEQLVEIVAQCLGYFMYDNKNSKV